MKSLGMRKCLNESQIRTLPDRMQRLGRLSYTAASHVRQLPRSASQLCMSAYWRHRSPIGPFLGRG
jgi:hypothetical protein